MIDNTKKIHYMVGIIMPVLEFGFLENDILQNFLQLSLSCTLFGIIFLIIWKKKLEIAKETAIGFLRGFFQLVLLATVLVFIFTNPNFFLLFIMISVMLVTAGQTCYRRVIEVPRAFPIVTFSIISGSLTTMLILLITYVPLKVEFIIPLFAMAIGNSMNIVALVLDRLIAQIKDNKDKIEVLLALGARSSQAIEKFVIASIRSSLIPTLNNVKTLGIVLIPGAMAGLLMGGQDPLIAAQYQIVIFMMIISAGLISASIAVTLVRQSIFSKADQLHFF